MRLKLIEHAVVLAKKRDQQQAPKESGVNRRVKRANLANARRKGKAAGKKILAKVQKELLHGHADGAGPGPGELGTESPARET